MEFTWDSFVSSSENIFTRIFGESAEPIGHLKSDYQLRMENAGWRFERNLDMITGFKDYSTSRCNVRELKKDLERYFPGKAIRLARAYNECTGAKISPSLKMIAIYTRDRK